MKKLIALLFALSVSLSAAEAPTVVVRDAANCYVNGVNAGNPYDAKANNPAIADLIQQAIDTFDAQQAAAAAARAAAQAAAAARAATR